MRRGMSRREFVGGAAGLALADGEQERQELFHPSARWIWDGGVDRPVDAYRLFRQTFHLKDPPERARLRITADAEYRLFVNGAYAGRGPAPNPPAHVSVDELDVARHLRRGENVLAVVVYHLGIPSFPRVLGRAGLLAQLDLPGQRIVTDSAWRWRDAWWEPTGERFSPFREFTEHLDGRREPVGWSAPGFNDNSWKLAVELGPARTFPWLKPEMRDIPLPGHSPVGPTGLLFTCSASAAIPPKQEAARELARMPGPPLEPSRVRNPNGLADTGGGSVEVDARGAAVVFALDFGREVSGFPEILADAERDGVVIDVGFGEGLQDGRHVTVLRQNNPDCDRFTLRSGSQALRVFHHRAFRYMVVAVRGGRVRLQAPRVIESTYPVRMAGRFACSDPRLDRIWEVGRHTMRMCMDQGFMDCPWRERGQYIGDGLAEGPVALYAFGDTQLMRRFLRQAALCQPPDGLLEPAYPSDWTLWHGRRGPWRIPGYGALWVVMVENYYRSTGDRELVQELTGTMDRLMRWFERHEGPDGLLREVPEWNFIDWAQMHPQSAMACLNLQHLMALKARTELSASQAGLSGARTTRIERFEKAFEAAHWEESRGLFRDAPNVYTVHTNALALLALVRDRDRAARIVSGLSAPDLLRPESPYFDGFVLRALCRHGRHDQALGMVRQKWGRMLDSGATTFWESYGGQWSLCHAWSCEPTAMLSRDILGLEYDAPARTVRFAPNPAGLDWARGAALFPAGEVSAGWRAVDGLDATLSAPPGIRVLLDLPAPPGAVLRVDGRRRQSRQENGRLLAVIRGGQHHIEVAPGG